MKKLGIFGCVLVFSLMLAMSVQAAGLLSPAIDVLQEDCAVLKTGVGKTPLPFRRRISSPFLENRNFSVSS